MTNQTPIPLASTPTSLPLAPGHWRVNAQRSSATFSALGFWVIPAAGRFDGLSGAADVDPDGSFEGELVIPTETLNTGNGLRDRHLKSAQFLDVRRYPEIKFVARRLTASAHGHVIDGELVVRDLRLPLTLPVRIEQALGEPVAISAQAALQRSAMGLTHSPLGMIRGPVHVELLIVLERER